jgi:hypothetical protein
VKWLRKRLASKTADFERDVLPRIPEFVEGAAVAEVVTRNATISARVDFSAVGSSRHRLTGRALQDPPEREAVPFVCRACDQLEHDSTVQIVSSPAYAWRRLGLVEPDGTPTRAAWSSHFSKAAKVSPVAAALEDERYAIDDLVFDLANIRGGPRFAGEDAVMGGRLGILCQRIYDRADFPGYLEMGTPVHYGLRRIGGDPRGRDHSRISLQADDGCAPLRRHRARDDGMAQSAPPYRARAGSRMGSLASAERSRETFHREYDLAGAARFSSTPRGAAAAQGCA